MSHKRQNQLVKNRKTRRVIRTIALVSRERGADNEAFAREVCKDLVTRGVIESFWAVPPKSYLDRSGIDVIVKTQRGFYFLNVKSSGTGVDNFNKTLQGKRRTIYPWLASKIYGSARAAEYLENILARYEPSCAVLPEDVRRGLEEPPKKPARESQAPKISAAKPAGPVQVQEPKIKKKTAVMRGYITVAAYLKLEEVKPWNKLKALDRTGHCLIKVLEVLQPERNRFFVRILVEIFGKEVSGRSESGSAEEATSRAVEIVIQSIIELPESENRLVEIAETTLMPAVEAPDSAQAQEPDEEERVVTPRGYVSVYTYLRMRVEAVPPQYRLRAIAAQGICQITRQELRPVNQGEGENRPSLFRSLWEVEIFGQNLKAVTDGPVREAATGHAAKIIVQKILKLPECKTSFLKIDGLF